MSLVSLALNSSLVSLAPNPPAPTLPIFTPQDLSLSPDPLGKGSYGIVYSGLIKQIKRHVAIKRNVATKTTQGIETLREMDVLARMNKSPFVIDLVGVLIPPPPPASQIARKPPPFFPRDFKANHFEESKQCDDWLHFILPLESTNLSKAIHREKFSHSHTKIIALQILLGLRDCHRQFIIHRDLKPANILLSTSAETKLPQVKLCDFGMCGLDGGEMLNSPGLVTVSHRAPEICLGESYSYGIDVFALGLIIFEMVGRKKLISISTRVSAKDEDETILKTLISAIPELTTADELAQLRRTSNSVPDLKKFPLETRKILTTHPSKRTITVSQRIQTLLKFSDSEIERFDAAVFGSDMSERVEGNESAGGGTFFEVCDLIARMLEFRPENRITVDQALQHPFFSAGRTFILKLPSGLIINPSPPTQINFNFPQRKLACAFMLEMWNQRKSIRNKKWYEHRILFHAMDVLDVYFASVSEQNQPLDEDTTYLRCYTAIYLFHKYFSTISPILPWKKFVGNRDFAGASAIERAIEFERELVMRCDFKIYRETLYEIYARKDGRVSENRVRENLIALSSGTGQLSEKNASFDQVPKLELQKTSEKSESDWEDVSSDASDETNRT